METINPQKEEFEFKKTLLLKELDVINNIIDRQDKFAQNTKVWAITLWAGLLTLIFGKLEIELAGKFVFLTSLIPIIFWVADATWRRIQNRTIYRSAKISEFLNSENLKASFEEQRFVGFHLWDPVGRAYEGDEPYKKDVAFWKIFWYETIMRFYLGMIIFSIILGVVVYFLY